jgi:hypothetical protein
MLSHGVETESAFPDVPADTVRKRAGVSEERERPEPAEPAGEPAGEPARKEAKPKARKRTPPRNPALLRALRAATPIEGTVVGVIKGGYEVRVEGSRGFCPHAKTIRSGWSARAFRSV